MKQISKKPISLDNLVRKYVNANLWMFEFNYDYNESYRRVCNNIIYYLSKDKDSTVLPDLRIDIDFVIKIAKEQLRVTKKRFHESNQSILVERLWKKKQNFANEIIQKLYKQIVIQTIVSNEPKAECVATGGVNIVYNYTFVINIEEKWRQNIYEQNIHFVKNKLITHVYFSYEIDNIKIYDVAFVKANKYDINSYRGVLFKSDNKIFVCKSFAEFIDNLNLKGVQLKEIRQCKRKHETFNALINKSFDLFELAKNYLSERMEQCEEN